ncbi:MAG: acid phosphatase [Gammaproteobacteria bacterium]|nr:acid phosphatase [Gammaproteobacteria bacterium]MDE2345636.1 acid phosphatase [Gammaproteobacteria bacterium]
MNISTYKRLLAAAPALAAAAVVFPAHCAPTTPEVGGQRIQHVVVVIEENKSFSTIIGNPNADYINQLAHQGMLFTNAHGVMHPSQPNYIALFSGSTLGVEDDACPRNLSGPNLASELLAGKLTFAIYSEDLPETGYPGCSASHGLYQRKHNMVADWQDAGQSPSLDRPFKEFPENYARLPSVAFVVPDMLHDMHDGTIAEGDIWLRVHLGRYARWAGSHHSLLIITWDESDARSASNRIPLIIVGAGIKTGRDAQYVNHYGVLRLIEDLYQLKPLGLSAAAEPIHALTGAPRA